VSTCWIGSHRRLLELCGVPSIVCGGCCQLEFGTGRGGEGAIGVVK
jgi:hypothetical protein